ncbi:MAG: hypothetical protein U0T32_00785 [Chitinophagales bacterium]
MIDEDKPSVFSKYNPCPQCGYIRDRTFIDRDVEIEKRQYDISYTLDGFLIVSEKFKQLFSEEEYPSIRYVKLNRYKNLYCLEIIGNILAFDAVKRQTEFINKCSACGNCAEVIGADPVYLKNINEPLAKGFYQTDLWFASFNRKHPLIIVDIETQQKMKAQKYRMLTFNPISI